MKLFTKTNCAVCLRDIADKERFIFARQAIMKRTEQVKKYSWPGNNVCIKTIVDVPIAPRPSFVGGSRSREDHSFAFCMECFNKIRNIARETDETNSSM